MMQDSNTETYQSDEQRIQMLELALSEANQRVEILSDALERLQRSPSFRLGALLTSPVRLLRRLLTPASARAGNHAAFARHQGVSRSQYAGVPTPEYAAWAKASLTGAAAPRPAVARKEIQPAQNDPFCAPPSSPLADPASREFYERNGFAVFRDIVDERACLADAQTFKQDLVREDYLVNPHTTLNLAEVYPPSRAHAFNPLILGAMRNCLGEDIRFLQWSTYQLNHMSFAWHRDAAYRVFGEGLDWDESEHPYRVAKIILYLECVDFALGVYPGSHKAEFDRSSISSDRRDFNELKRFHRSAPLDLYGKPCAVHARSGDAIVFDQRLMHCGRLLDDELGAFTRTIKGDKSFISFLYGADNPHSFRMFSYYNQERGFPVSAMGEELVERLKAENLYLSIGQANHFDTHPLERKNLWLPQAGAAA